MIYLYLGYIISLTDILVIELNKLDSSPGSIQAIGGETFGMQ